MAALSRKVITLKRPLCVTFGVTTASVEVPTVLFVLTVALSFTATAGIEGSSNRVSEMLACLGLSTEASSLTMVTEKRDFLTGFGVVTDAFGTSATCGDIADWGMTIAGSGAAFTVGATCFTAAVETTAAETSVLFVADTTVVCATNDGAVCTNFAACPIVPTT